MLGSLGWAATAWVLVTYAVMARTGRERPFHWANALGCVPLIALNVLAGVWPAVVLNVTFGLLGWAALRPRLPRGGRYLVWHPESPGSRITVYRPWWRRKSRFASLRECLTQGYGTRITDLTKE